MKPCPSHHRVCAAALPREHFFTLFAFGFFFSSAFVWWDNRYLCRFFRPWSWYISPHVCRRCNIQQRSVRSRTAKICPQRITSWTTQGTRARTGERPLRMQVFWRKLMRMRACSFMSMLTLTSSLVQLSPRYGTTAETIWWWSSLTGQGGWGSVFQHLGPTMEHGWTRSSTRRNDCSSFLRMEKCSILDTTWYAATAVPSNLVRNTG